jgi:hypothetical protein
LSENQNTLAGHCNAHLRPIYFGDVAEPRRVRAFEGGPHALGLVAVPASLSLAVQDERKPSKADDTAASLEALRGIIRDLDKYRAPHYIEAAVALQAQGEAKAKAALKIFAKKDHRDFRTVVLCRMLFTAKPDKDFRRSNIGAPHFVGRTVSKDWPLDPIVLIDDVPILLTLGHALAGIGEHPSDYLQYCVDNCDWSKTAYKRKTPEELTKALETLLADKRLAGRLSKSEREFLADQITADSK